MAWPPRPTITLPDALRPRTTKLYWIKHRGDLKEVRSGDSTAVNDIMYVAGGASDPPNDTTIIAGHAAQVNL